MSKEVLATAKEKMTKAEESLRRELGQIRAGRANASLLDRHPFSDSTINGRTSERISQRREKRSGKLKSCCP